MPEMTADKKGWTVPAALKYAPRLQAHLELVDRHIVALRNAMGVARALGRQLVMPKFLCVCDRAESPFALLPTCKLEGTSQSLPFVCPLESIFDVVRVEEFWKRGFLQLHPWTLLNGSIHKPPQRQDRSARTAAGPPQRQDRSGRHPAGQRGQRPAGHTKQ